MNGRCPGLGLRRTYGLLAQPGVDLLYMPKLDSMRTESRNSVDCNAHDNSRYLARLKGESYSPFTDPMNPPGTNRKSEANHE